MKWVLKGKWIVVLAWLAIALTLALVAPSLGELVREKGQINVPDGYSSTQAEAIIKTMSDGEEVGESTALVFHDEQGFTAEKLSQVEQTIRTLQENSEQLGITAVHTHFDTPELAEQMYSADDKTVLALLYVNIGERTADEARNELYGALEGSDIEHYFTGDWIIVEDVIISSENGLKKTEYITVAFILLILFIVFRSAAAPFVPLLTVGISYLVAQSIVAFLAHYWDFPLSNFTQIFMVAILFGIGTDYCILLISRFKEEYAEKQHIESAVIATYRTAGKTVLFSAIAVLVGFTSIGFSTFILYRSAVAVAVGIAVMMLAIYTLVPFFLAVLGKGLFWPIKGKIEHKPSKLWEKVGTFSLTKPVRAVFILVVIIVPLLVSYKGLISFNSLDEIGEKYNSVKGFNIISDSFGPGEALPTTVVVKSAKPLDTPEGISLVELTTRELLKVDGVSKVRSASRPLGDVLEQFLVADQVELLEQGIADGNEGLSQISSGLTEASDALSTNAPQLLEAAEGAEQLVAGTIEVQSGVNQLAAGLAQLTAGAQEGKLGADQLAAGLEQIKASAAELLTASQSLLEGYQSATAGLTELSSGYGQIAAEQAKLADGLVAVEQGLQGLAAAHPDLQTDELYLQLVGSVGQLSEGAMTIGSHLEQMNTALASILGGLTEANNGYEQAIVGQTALTGGLQQFVDSLNQLSAGLQQIVSGQEEIGKQLPSMEQGLGQLASAQTELQAGFVTIEDQLAELTAGLDQSVDGLEQVRAGFASATVYLQGLTNSPDKQLTGWYIPEEAIAMEEFQQALDTYMSNDRQVMTFDVVFAANPYSQAAMDQIDQLSAVVHDVFAQSKYSDVEVYVGGVTSMNHDLSTISDEDYSRTVLLMLVGIFLVLLILFRSVIMPIYIVISLIITFYTSLAITELLFVQILGLSGVSWAVPFFGFVILLALGVDYSIFLMDRFKENRHMEPSKALLEAMKSMGSVIISAAIILGGTFAAMLPSGVMSLLQIATLVLCGLFLYALVMLPLFIPVMVKLFGKYNWWPFMKNEYKGMNP